MLCRHQKVLDNAHIVLGSKSPQRKRILTQVLGLKYECIGSNFEEDIDKSSCESPADYCLKTSYGKIEDLNETLQFNYDLLICSDTIVVTNDGEIFEKPNNENDAKRMLSALNNNTCSVISSCIISYRISNHIPQVEAFYDITKVKFNEYTMNDIESYIATGEPYTKSGGFGLQSLGASLIRGIDGDYYNVEGFPVGKFGMILSMMIDKGAAGAAAGAAAASGDSNMDLEIARKWWNDEKIRQESEKSENR